MRAVSLKSLCLLAGFVVPCLGTSSQAEAGVIPWLYNSIFGYGWGHNYGGYGGGVPYSVGYGSMGYGYGGYGYSGASYPTYTPSYSNFGYGGAPSSCGCSTGISAAPVMSAPINSNPTPAPGNAEPKKDEGVPADGNYNLNYQPSVGYYDYYTGYSPAYVVDSGSCCVPCLNCANGDCSTSSTKSSKPEAEPTPADSIKKGPPGDNFGPTKNGTRNGTGTGSGTGDSPVNVDEALPGYENKPATKPGAAGEVGADGLEPPVNNDAAPNDINERGGAMPSDRSVAVRYNPTLKRSAIAIPASVARVVRADRSSRVVVAGKPDSTLSQVAAKP